MPTNHNDDALDENGLLKDGRSIRVSMQMADSASDGLRKVVHEYDEKGREKSSFHYQEDDLEKLMKDHANISAAARAIAIKTMCDAWKNPDPVTGERLPDQKPAMVKDATAARALVDAAYKQMVADKQNAWR